MDLPFKEIPSYPASFSAGNVVVRMIDGLGYRYYWATEELRPADLKYRPSEDGKTAFETLQHLYGVSETILNAIKNVPNSRPYSSPNHSFDRLRKLTLENLKEASSLLQDKTEETLECLSITYQRGEVKSDFSFWHLFNGPLADALYHTGQIVVFRRASGNPMNPKVNVLIGKNNP